MNDFQKLMEVIVKKRDDFLKETGMIPDTIIVNEEQCKLMANNYSTLDVKEIDNEPVLYMCNMKIIIDKDIKTNKDIIINKRRWG